MTTIRSLRMQARPKRTGMERSAREIVLARGGYENGIRRMDAHGWHSHALPPPASVLQQCVL
eukprot:SM000370S13773  [mRNA]  locus=s370:24302:24494:+ [translate_table: standard]